MSEAEPYAQEKRFVLPEDGTLMRWAFFFLLAACVILVALDVGNLATRNDEIMERIERTPILPALVPAPSQQDGEPVSNPYSPVVESDPSLLRQPLDISLNANNELVLSGAIDPGSSTRFADEIEKVSEYVETVVLNSPGGSVQDALEISKLIRKNEWHTTVRAGALCASSCPIIFAGGIKRSAEEKAAIGVHQIFSAGDDRRSLDQAISGTQSSTATIVRHLEEMGIDPAIWTHALETPPASLYYLRDEEMKDYKLVTGGDEVS